jgi:hypothetical protein
MIWVCLYFLWWIRCGTFGFIWSISCLLIEFTAIYIFLNTVYFGIILGSCHVDTVGIYFSPNSIVFSAWPSH